MSLQEVAIRALFDRSYIAIDIPDGAESGKTWSECFTQDGKYESPFGNVEGRPNLAALIKNLHDSGSINGKRHVGGPAKIEIHGDKATAFSYYFVLEAGAGKLPAVIASGTYTDELVHQGGQWLLARRVHTIDPAYFELAKSWAAAPVTNH